MLQFQLDLKGIACSKGSACQSGSNQQSHVLSAILNDDKLKQPSVRFSFSIYNTKEELDYVTFSVCKPEQFPVHLTSILNNYLLRLLLSIRIKSDVYNINTIT